MKRNASVPNQNFLSTFLNKRKKDMYIIGGQDARSARNQILRYDTISRQLEKIALSNFPNLVFSSGIYFEGKVYVLAGWRFTKEPWKHGLETSILCLDFTQYDKTKSISWSETKIETGERPLPCQQQTCFFHDGYIYQAFGSDDENRYSFESFVSISQLQFPQFLLVFSGLFTGYTWKLGITISAQPTPISSLQS